MVVGGRRDVHTHANHTSDNDSVDVQDCASVHRYIGHLYDRTWSTTDLPEAVEFIQLHRGGTYGVRSKHPSCMAKIIWETAARGSSLEEHPHCHTNIKR